MVGACIQGPWLFGTFMIKSSYFMLKLECTKREGGRREGGGEREREIYIGDLIYSWDLNSSNIRIVNSYLFVIQMVGYSDAL